MVGIARVGAAALMAAGASAVYLDKSTNLPVVDLGYEIHRASNFDAEGKFYNFSNIRYAQAPVGELRFAKPVAPEENRAHVNTGEQGRICPAATPAWGAAATTFLGKKLIGLPTNDTEEFVPPPIDWNATIPAMDPRTSEDCLFLDVYAPQKVLTNIGNGAGAPVLVWIYGGGYTAGNKYNNPEGLLAASGMNNVTGNGNCTEGEIIYVSFNYRLGSLGFMSGPTYNAEGGVSNLAFYDQRFALEWVQKYIHLFGGDKSRVTVIGESAGGGSIMHQITAYGGSKGPAPFQRAIPQSPGWIPIASQTQQEDSFQQMLEITNTTSLAELRALSTEDMIKANYLQIYSAPYATFRYGPVVDGDFAPLLPGQLLAQGRFDKKVEVMVGHNGDEGAYFTPPTIDTEEEVAESLRQAMPYIPEPSLRYITKTLYPPVFDGTYGYTTQYERSDKIVSEAIFTCNTFFLDKAFKNQTYSYLFNLPPALHGQDVAYTFYDGSGVSPSPLGVKNTTVAVAMQEFFTSFAMNGKPEAPGIREFRMYGPDANVLELAATSINEIMDPNANERCNWWQKGLVS